MPEHVINCLVNRFYGAPLECEMSVLCQDEQTVAFLNWFTSNGGVLNSAVGIADFPGMGGGAIALEDIKKDTTLFTLPRSLTLSLRTSALPQMFGIKAWKKYRLHQGWVGLILCLMWENASGKKGKWYDYLQTLPSTFNTPMFWDQEDLVQLEGTSIFDKIGRKDADADYEEKLLPAVKSRSDLFNLDQLDAYYSIKQYHIMGSCILSRSFHVEETVDEDEGTDGRPEPASHDGEDDMMVDDVVVEEDNVSDESYSSDEDDPADVAMVPIADLLNAQYKSENAKLCYEFKDLEMIATKPIKKGQQIFNTYGDPPNSDLLRRYGHVDLIPLKGGMIGNPADIVEIRADIVVDVLKQLKVDERSFERIDWWLDRGDDAFNYVVEEDEPKTPPGLISFIRLLTMPDTEWLKTQDKGKIPKPKMDQEVVIILKKVLELRLKQYRTTLEEDERLFQTDLSENMRMAVMVRIGEKRILQSALRVLSFKGVLGTDSRNSRKRASSRSPEQRTFKVSKT